MSAVRTARRLCFGAGVLCAVLAGATTLPAHADSSSSSGADPTAGRPGNFAGVASAAGVFQTVDRVHGALTPAAQTVFGRLPDGFSQYSPEVLTARSSVYWPGAGIAGLGTLLCTAGAVIPPPFDVPFNLVACHFPK